MSTNKLLSQPLAWECVCNWIASIFVTVFLHLAVFKGLLAPGEIDPLNRRFSTIPNPDVVVQGELTSPRTPNDVLNVHLKYSCFFFFSVNPGRD